MTKTIPTTTPITPATKDRIGRILLIIITIRFKSVRITANAKRHRADNADIILAIIINARDTIILLHKVKKKGISWKHVDGKFTHNVMPLFESHLCHRPTIDVPKTIVLVPLKHT